MKPSFLVAAAMLLAACTQPEAPAPVPEVETSEASLEAPDPTNAAGAPEGELPAGWQWRFDRGTDYSVGSEKDSVDAWFVTMTPGWHITTQPAGIFYHPGNTAEGQYTARTKISLFDPGERNEGYGMIVGGSALDGPDQTYLYFLIRRSGEFLVKHRSGSETGSLVGWTANDAIEAWTEESEGAVSNVLSVTVGPETIGFSVNDTEVASVPREGLPTDGLVGLRFNHATNAHVTELAIIPAT
jgi:hypothetical protein